MIIYNAQQTAAALPYPALIAAIDALFAQQQTAPLRQHYAMPKAQEADATLLLMPVWSEAYGCVKIVTVTPHNAQRGLAAVCASVLVFENTSGQHVALLDGATLTARRTAASAALAAKYLARTDSKTLLIVGAGRVGTELAPAFAAVRPLEQILIWNPSPARAIALVQQLQQQGFAAEHCSDLERGVKHADMISCATLATTPLIKGEWLQAGQHLDLIGAFTPSMREADDLALQRASVYIDTEAALHEAGELLLPLQQGVISQADIHGTLYDLCQHKRTRRNDDEITCFKAVGNAVMDLAAATLVVQLCGDVPK